EFTLAAVFESVVVFKSVFLNIFTVARKTVVHFHTAQYPFFKRHFVGGTKSRSRNLVVCGIIHRDFRACWIVNRFEHIGAPHSRKTYFYFRLRYRFHQVYISVSVKIAEALIVLTITLAVTISASGTYLDHKWNSRQ